MITEKDVFSIEMYQILEKTVKKHGSPIEQCLLQCLADEFVFSTKFFQDVKNTKKEHENLLTAKRQLANDLKKHLNKE